MKKITLSFMLLFLFSGIANAATLSLSLFSGSGTILQSSGTSVSASGAIANFGIATDVYKIQSNPGGSATGFAIGTPDAAVEIQHFALYSDSSLINLLVSGTLVGNPSHEKTLSYMLVSGVDYFLKILAKDLVYDSRAPSYTLNVASAVPVPAAIWLFGTALMGLFGVSRRKASVMTA